MGILGGPFKEGAWFLSSEKDPRWNVSGRGFVGGLVMPKECEDKIEELKKKYGQPPDDLRWGYCKD